MLETVGEEQYSQALFDHNEKSPAETGLNDAVNQLLSDQQQVSWLIHDVSHVSP